MHFGGGGKLKPGALLELGGFRRGGGGGLGVIALGLDWAIMGGGDPVAIALPVDGDEGTVGSWGLCM